MSKSARREKRAERDERRRGRGGLLPLVDTMTPTPVRASRAPLMPKTDAQAKYMALIDASIVTFGLGPAGTGKTFCAVAKACDALIDNKTDREFRLYITRPAVEAEGERLGFLPGELEEKYEPFLAPVREILNQRLGASFVEYLLKNERIVARPLAYMRGHTLANCWVIADEMQNASQGQFKLLLSRIGENAKVVVNGDASQVDPGVKSGLTDAVNRLKGVRGIESFRFGRGDIVRSGICQAIVERYENYNDDDDSEDDDECKQGILKILRAA